MERLLSDEEKIRKAIEISQRRNKSRTLERTTAVNSNNKKDYGLFKRMFLQLLICLLIYGIFYLITTTNYVFSDDVINKTSNILNYDIEIKELYSRTINKIKEFINSNTSDKEKNNVIQNVNNQTNNVEEEKVENTIENKVEEVSNIQEEKKEVTVSLSQMEKDVIKAKKICDFIKPLSGTITSEFGEREVTSKVMSSDHKGIDIAANKGTKIKSAITGQVEVASSNSQYGNFVKIKKDDVLTVYAHCDTLKVSKGDKVKKGEVIATVGSTGNSTGPHLHFEIRLSNRYINPRLVIQF